MAKQKQDVEGDKKKIFTLFLLFFPSIIIAAIPNEIDGGVMLPLVIKILVIFWQFVAIKNFIDSHYGE